MLVATSHFGIYSKISKIDRQDRTTAQRTFFAIMDFMGEVNNGGLEQYFLNGSGMDAPIIEACFREVGAHNCADLAGKAFEIVEGETIPWAQAAERKQRIWDISDTQWDQLAELDAILWGDPDPLEQLMVAYVEAHAADLTWPPDPISWPLVRAIRGSLSTGEILELVLDHGPETGEKQE